MASPMATLPLAQLLELVVPTPRDRHIAMGGAPEDLKRQHRVDRFRTALHKRSMLDLRIGHPAKSCSKTHARAGLRVIGQIMEPSVLQR